MSGGVRRWALWALAFLGGGDLAAGTAYAQEEPEGARIVTRVQIEGNRTFSEREIRRAIATEPSRCKSFFLKPFCAFGAFRERRTFDAQEFQLDAARLKVFYWRRGYREAQVDTVVRRNDGEVAVRFEIAEGEPVRVRTLAVAGVEGILPDTAALRRRLALKIGAPFSVPEVEAARGQIEGTLRNRGYAHAEVLLDAFLPRDEPYAADVTFQVEPGPLAHFGQIHVLGTERVEDRVVRRLLTFRSRDLYRESEILRSQRNLYSVALFQYADVTPQLESRDSAVDVWVRVSEGKVHVVREGFGVSTTECFQVEASWTHRNFFGSARRLQVGGALSNLLASELGQRFPCEYAGSSLERSSANVFNKPNWITRLDFQQPWFFSPRNSLGIGFFAERQSLPDIFVRKSFGGDVTVQRRIGSRTSLDLTYRAQRDELPGQGAAFFFCGNFGFCLPEDIGELSQPRWLSWVALGLARDRTDAVFNPTRGYLARLEVEHASRFTGSQYAYYRAWADASVFRRFAGGVLAARLRPGWVRPIGRGLEVEETESLVGEAVVHPFKRFYGGGATTVRGFAQNLLGPVLLFLPDTARLRVECGSLEIEVVRSCDLSGVEPGAFQPRPLGGTVAVLGNFEYRFPLLGERWFGAAFVDWGNVWKTEDDFVDALQRGLVGDLVWAPGLGIRYLSPVGPLRVDVGYNTIGGRLFPVVTQIPPRTGELVELERLFRYDPFSDQSGFKEFLNRLQFHFSIGQAF